jgi:hypothetical protein
MDRLNAYPGIESPSASTRLKSIDLRAGIVFFIVLKSVALMLPVRVRLVTVFISSGVSNADSVPAVST